MPFGIGGGTASNSDRPLRHSPAPDECARDPRGTASCYVGSGTASNSDRPLRLGLHLDSRPDSRCGTASNSDRPLRRGSAEHLLRRSQVAPPRTPIVRCDVPQVFADVGRPLWHRLELRSSAATLALGGEQISRKAWHRLELRSSAATGCARTIRAVISVAPPRTPIVRCDVRIDGGWVCHRCVAPPRTPIVRCDGCRA